MPTIADALRGTQQEPPGSLPQRPAVLVAGAAGTLGSAVVEQLLACRAFAPVRVLTTRPFAAVAHGIETLTVDAAAGRSDLGVVVFDRARHANGRDDAFVRPLPEHLGSLARQFVGHGVRDLIVVLPHRAASLPQALRAGLANLDEQALAAMGFERVVLVRSAQAPEAAGSRGLQGLADLVLRQLRLMTPQAQMPVRALAIARLVAALARHLPGSAAGTRVMPPERVWQASQVRDPTAFAQAWLHGLDLEPVRARPGRM